MEDFEGKYKKTVVDYTDLNSAHNSLMEKKTVVIVTLQNTLYASLRSDLRATTFSSSYNICKLSILNAVYIHNW